MKKFLLISSLLLCGLAAYCAAPLMTVSALTIRLSDQTGRKITKNAHAIFLDTAGAEIVRIDTETRGSWENNLHWWAHSQHRQSKLTPNDARRAVSARVEAEGCKIETVPVVLKRRYEPPSLAPHGGSAAYIGFTFEIDLILQCG